MKLTNKKFLSILEENSKENPFNIDEYDKQSVIDCRLNYNPNSRIFIEMTCVECSKVCTKILRRQSCNINFLTYCSQCNQRRTFNKLYGVDHISQLEEIKEKKRETCKKNFGVEYPSQSKEIKQKIEDSNLKNYGCKNVFQNEEIKERIKQKNIENLGVEYPMQSKICKEKSKKTCKEHFGVEYSLQDKHIRELGKQTSLDRYGVENYGALTRPQKYEFDNLKFDSFWELAFYLYHIDKDHDIEREPCKFEYYVGNAKHYYFPDFRVGNKYYEIKGDHLIDFYKNGKIKTLKTLSKGVTTESKEKYKCMKKHNVRLIYSKQIKKYIDYVESNYDKDFLDNLKVNKKNEKD